MIYGARCPCLTFSRCNKSKVARATFTICAAFPVTHGESSGGTGAAQVTFNAALSHTTNNRS